MDPRLKWWAFYHIDPREALANKEVQEYCEGLTSSGSITMLPVEVVTEFNKALVKLEEARATLLALLKDCLQRQTPRYSLCGDNTCGAAFNSLCAPCQAHWEREALLNFDPDED